MDTEREQLRMAVDSAAGLAGRTDIALPTRTIRKMLDAWDERDALEVQLKACGTALRDRTAEKHEVEAFVEDLMEQQA